MSVADVIYDGVVPSEPSEVKLDKVEALVIDDPYGDYLLGYNPHVQGHDITLDDVHGQLAWLKARGYMRTEWVGEFAQVAILTMSGLDVAEGRARADGIERTLPE